MSDNYQKAQELDNENRAEDTSTETDVKNSQENPLAPNSGDQIEQTTIEATADKNQKENLEMNRQSTNPQKEKNFSNTL